MPTLALCMIVKNEENYLDACLSSVKDVIDEFVIVDTGSTDNTKNIIKKYTNNDYNFKWCNDFAAARNESFKLAKSEWLMWLDADDILKPEDLEKLKELKPKLNDINMAINMIYDYAHDEMGNVTLALKRNRIVKNDENARWEGFVHEIIPISINESYPSDIHVTHTRVHSNGTRNLDLFKAKRKEGHPFTPRDTLYFAKELYYNGLYSESLKEFDSYLNQPNRWIEDEIDARIKIADMYKIKGNIKDCRRFLCSTFDLDIRAEALFPLAASYSEEKKYEQAIFFFESILRLQYPTDCAGFLNEELWTIRPLIELSCVYYYMGNFDKGREYHLRAKRLQPNNPVVCNNDQFFL